MGHLICITNQEDIEDFDLRCKKIEDKIQYATDKITIDELGEIFLIIANIFGFHIMIKSQR